MKSAVKAALGKFSITPAIDFDVEPLFDFPTRTKDASTKQPTVGFNPDYNPFEKRQAPLTPRQISNRDNWDKMIPPKDFSFGKETDSNTCLLYTSDAADDLPCVDLGGRRILK